MKVAIDTSPLVAGHSFRGIGVHTRELVDALKLLKRKNLQIAAVDFTKTDLSGFDIVHYQSFHPFFITLPLRKSDAKAVVTIHDLIPLIYPKHYLPGIKGSLRFLIQKILIQKVDAIITISETSKKDISRFLGIDPKKIHVVYLAPKKIFKKLENNELLNSVRKKYKLPDKFVLYVGDVNYNKNIPNLIKACKIANMKLVIAGKQARDIESRNLDHPELMHLRNIDWPEVVRLGFVADEDLVAIYNLANVYCQPSFYEGFGLPVLEAIACGTPVVAAKTQSLVEVAGGAVTFVDPKSVKDIAKGLVNPKKTIILPREYSWKKTAEETLKVYEEV